MERREQAKPPWQVGPEAWRRGRRLRIVSTPFFQLGSWSETGNPTLMAAKEKITELETSKRWELIKKMVNPYEMVFTHEDPHFHPSLSLIKPLSRSYFKLLEMLDVMKFFEMLPKQQPKLRTAHVAEGPGGFIQAVLDLAERHKRTVTRATAMTLKPTDNCVPGWRRATAFLYHHKEVKLHYGVDGTGDVYSMGNQDSFIETVAPGVHLFTADGGFDFSINYAEQEQRVYHLLLCSATIGLRSLLPDGAMVLKLFDTASEATQALILLMGSCFQEWILYKPALSRPCNSERYFLGRGFRGLPSGVLDTLLQLQTASLQGLYPRGIASVMSEAEDLSYLEAQRQVADTQQLEALHLAEDYSVNPGRWAATQIQSDFQTSLEWCMRFRIPTALMRPVAPLPPPLGRPECIAEPDAGPR